MLKKKEVKKANKSVKKNEKVIKKEEIKKKPAVKPVIKSVIKPAIKQSQKSVAQKPVREAIIIETEEEIINPDILEEGMLEEDINPFNDKYEE
ncbi:MAG: hypothetical protein NTV72_00225 [Candidatus Taylorbacteria bacterium]|nr:hypothetical protein [Candidatus Taylorbacteria bacterium]